MTAKFPTLPWLLMTSLLIALAALVLIHGRLAAYADDDAYIHFRIAENLARYGAPYFNPAEPVKASSASGWTILLSLLATAGVNLPQAVAVLNAILTTAGAAVYALLLNKLGPPPHPRLSTTLFFIAYMAVSVQPSISLMETPLAMLLVGVGLHLLLARRAAGLAALSAAVFFRLELGILLVLATGWAIFGVRLPLKRTGFYLLLGAFPFVMADGYFFKTLLPNTIAAKSVVYAVHPLLVLRMISDSLLPGELPGELAGVFFKLLYVIAAIGAGAVLIGQSGRKSAAADACLMMRGLIFVWGVATLAAYVASSTFIFPWYVPLYAVPLFLALGSTLPRAAAGQTRLAATVFFAPLLAAQLISLGWVAAGAAIDPGYYPAFVAGARVRHYMAVAEQLYHKYPTATLMTSEIGGLGYSFKGRIVDGAGLISPEALRYHPMNIPDERSAGHIGAIPVGFIREVNPELIVSYDHFIEAFLRSPLKSNYHQIQQPVFLADDMQRSPTKTLWGSEHLNIFIRNDLELP